MFHAFLFSAEENKAQQSKILFFVKEYRRKNQQNL